MTPHLHQALAHRPSPLLELRRWRFTGTASYWCPRGAHAGSLEITWVHSGRVTYRVGRRELTLEPGTAVLVPPDVEHATGFIDPAVPVDSAAIHLDAALLEDVAEVLGAEAHRPQPCVVQNASRIIAAGRLLLGQTDDGPGSRLAAEALAEVLAVEALRAGLAHQNAAGASTDRRIAAAVQQIEACFAEPLSVDDLARTAAMSRFHFSRRFREVTGQSPYRYLIETRLRHAAALLRRGHHSVTEAALSAGFTDLGRFSRMFRQWSGTAPHRYGRAARFAHDPARTA
jgi:AraC-like DNA-binding protein